MLVNERKTSVVMGTLALLLVCSLPRVSVSSVDAEVGIPGILPVVIVSGSDYEMGYQYGQQAAPYIQKTKEAAIEKRGQVLFVSKIGPVPIFNQLAAAGSSSSLSSFEGVKIPSTPFSPTVITML